VDIINRYNTLITLCPLDKISQYEQSSNRNDKKTKTFVKISYLKMHARLKLDLKWLLINMVINSLVDLIIKKAQVVMRSTMNQWEGGKH